MNVPNDVFFKELADRYADDKAFVARIRALMKLHKITTTRLAKRSGFLPMNISRWLGPNPTRVPCMESKVVLDDALARLIAGR